MEVTPNVMIVRSNGSVLTAPLNAFLHPSLNRLQRQDKLPERYSAQGRIQSVTKALITTQTLTQRTKDAQIVRAGAFARLLEWHNTQ